MIMMQLDKLNPLAQRKHFKQTEKWGKRVQKYAYYASTCNWHVN